MKQLFNRTPRRAGLLFGMLFWVEMLAAQPVSQPISLCAGDIFRGRLISKDTQILIQNPSPALADTLFLVHAIPPVVAYFNQIVCPGELFLGQIFQKDTVIKRLFSAETTGCDSIAYYFLTVKTNSALSVSGDSAFCKGGKTTLSVGFFPKYKWSSGQTTREIEVAQTGNFTITATDADGCNLVAAFPVFVSDPQLGFEAMPPRCPKTDDGMIDLLPSGALAPFVFQLNFDKTGPDGLFENLAPGDFTATMVDAAGCRDTAQISLAEPAPLAVAASPDITLGLGETTDFSLDILGSATAINWSPAAGLSCSDCANPTVSPEKTTLFIVKIENQWGCTASDSIRLTLEKRRRVFFPNIFNPETDGGLFTVFAGNAVTEIRRFQVFDRTGGLVFEAKNRLPGDPELDWDGGSRGKKCPPGVYLFAASITFGDGAEEQFSGDVTLVR